MTSALDRLWPLIRQLQGALDGRTIRSGTETLTWSASANSGTVTVTHGLPAAPTEVTATSKGAPGFGNIPNCNVFAISDTTFALNAEVKTAFSGSVTVSWIAVA
jgi:hypothetical protein